MSFGTLFLPNKEVQTRLAQDHKDLEPACTLAGAGAGAGAGEDGEPCW